MAKQTFTTGQVLTAAQMTSLQQTAMLGGAASAKTASYTLVAADAGTAISMSNASATTITVNTALFAAGDTVQITNLGAGVCTITAGTATVNTSASLALAQYESGTLDFTSTSAAIFIKGAAAASGGMTLLSTTTLTGSATTISSISGSYKQLLFILSSITPSSAASLTMTLNGDTSSIYGMIALNKEAAVGSTVTTNNTASFQLTTATNLRNSDTEADGYIYFTDYSNAVVKKNGYFGWSYIGNGNVLCAKAGNLNWTDPAAITSATFTLSAGTFSLGTIKTYGVS